jgi:hypothetical protein
MSGMKDECECVLCISSNRAKTATKVKPVSTFKARPRAPREIQTRDGITDLGEEMKVPNRA